MLTESVNFTGFTLNRIAEFNPFSVLSAKKEQEDGLFMGRSKVVSIQKQCPATWEEALQQFLWWKQAQGLSKRTVEDYKPHVTMFYKRYPAAYREKDCLKQAAFEYMGQPIKPATYNMRLIYLRSFCNWCPKEAIMVYNHTHIVGATTKETLMGIINTINQSGPSELDVATSSNN